MDKSPSRLHPSYFIGQTVRWKVVKMAHKINDDMEVAKMLLDCYDAITSGCLQWKNDSKRSRLPHCTSDKGWELLEEIKYMMQWQDRQDDRKKKQILTVWTDDNDDECDDDVDTQDNNEKEEIEKEGEMQVIVKKEIKDDWDKQILVKDPDTYDVGNAIDDDDWEPDDPMSEVTVNFKQKISKSTMKKKKKKKSYPPQGYREHQRRTNAEDILNTPTQIKVIECKRCLERFSALEVFEEHYKSHTEAVIIGKEVVRVADLKVPDIPVIATIFIPCKECNELTDKPYEHQINKHFRRPCEICGQIYTSYGGWSRHMKQHRAEETGIYPHVCDKCGKSFPYVGKLTLHRKRHSTERSHICEICGKGFKLKTGLSRHLSIHTAKSLACEFCGKTFNYKFNLKTHLRTHTGEKPFQCTTCGKSYSHNSGLKAHAKSEHGIDMEYGCQKLMEFEDLSTILVNK